ncbi:MAG: PadR family transcriptional regulator [Smithella sp.]
MTLQYALLGFLNYGPMTGYDLKKLLDTSTQMFWHAELSQIYPQLKKMEKEGLVTAIFEHQAGKPDKKYYTIASQGRAVLLQWLSEPLDELLPDKDPVLLHLFFAGALDKQAILSQLRLQLELRRAYLSRVEGEVAAFIQETIRVTGQKRDGLFWELIRRYGAEQTRTSIAWLEEAIQVVENELT